MVILDYDGLNERELTVDLEKGHDNLIDEGSNDSSLENVSSSNDYSNKGEELSDTKKKKRKWTKKPPKPPRPPRSPSMDAADQKFFREISELAMLKRARVERMKALRRIKNARSTNSKSSHVAFVVTVVFCIVILWQGLWPRSGSVANFQGSPESPRRARSGFISVQPYNNRYKNGISNMASLE